MGNDLPKLTACLSAPSGASRHNTSTENVAEGYSYSYGRPSSASSSITTTFRWISGASVSANTSTPPSSTLLFDDHHNHSHHNHHLPSAVLDCSCSFYSAHLHPSTCGPLSLSGPLPDFSTTSLSGPILTPRPRFFSGPLDRDNSFFSEVAHLPPRVHATSLSRKGRVYRVIRRAISRTIVRGHNSIVAPITGVVIKKMEDLDKGEGGANGEDSGSLHWAQGKAGEDRVQVVVCEQQGLLFVGIYDGFNGPDAPDYLLSNLYSAVHAGLNGLLWQEEERDPPSPPPEQEKRRKKGGKKEQKEDKERKRRRSYGWNRKSYEEEKPVDHGAVLEALSGALLKTEEGFLGIADTMATEHPELGLMGSCVLVMLMKGEDVYLMNVGDSRAVVARKPEVEVGGEVVEGIKEEDKVVVVDGSAWLVPLQLTMDHSTCVVEEVDRIRGEHPEDAAAVTNHRVKGSLKVTRAFGAGFLKKPKWNNALLERFRIDYVGNSPYISCLPSLRHHKLGSGDRFLILSSDGLYQYFTNEEAVSEVEYFVATTPDGDPAQHLVEEALFRAAHKAGLDFQELLQIPQGDRRRQYHDDISVVIVSLEGRIWKSCL